MEFAGREAIDNNIPPHSFRFFISSVCNALQ